jgi:hypothetical protein
MTAAALPLARCHAKESSGSGAPSTRRTAIALCALAAATLLLALATAPAQAASKRVFEETFGSAAQPTFVQAQGMAVDYGSGDLYVLDVGAGAKTLSRWHSDGTPSPFEALGTNVIDGKGAGACTFPPTPSPDCDQTPQNELDLPSPFFATGRKEVQVAIDESGTTTDGNIYLTQRGLHLVDIFAADGHYLGQLTGFKKGPSADGAEREFEGGPNGVTVDGDGAVYVTDDSLLGVVGPGTIHKYVATAAFPADADNVANFTTPPQALAVAAGAGPSEGYLFFNTGNAATTYKLEISTGEVVGDPISTNNENTVAVSPGSGNVFVGKGFGEIKEFDASGAEPLEVSSTVPASFVMGFAPAAAGDRLYVAREKGPNVEVFSAPLPSPVVVTNPATNVAETSATLNGTVSRQGLATEGCRFEYVTDAKYQANKAAKANLFSGATLKACAETNAEIDAGTEPAPVHADLTGLAAGELFHFRLSATTEAGTVQGNEQTFATTVPPTIEAEQASAITDSEATIKVLINPKFYATTFHVEYGPGSSFALSTPETAVGSDGVAHPLVVSLTGLAPGTTYEWRIVATSANGLSSESAAHSFTTYRPFLPDTACPNQALRGGPSAVLPDCRAYEMVSPVDKNGGDIFNGANLNSEHAAYIQATADGEKITYTAEPAFAGQLSARYYNQYIAARGAGGWDNSGVNLPLGEQLPLPIRFEREVNAFSEDLCSMWTYDYNATPLNPDAQEGFSTLYRRQNCPPGVGSLETLNTAAPLSAGTPTEYVRQDSVQGFSADGSAVFFVALAQLPTAAGTPEAADTTEGQVYLHLAGDPELRLVSVLPSGEAAAPAAGTENGVGGGNGLGIRGNLQNAVSSDGTRVFWSANLDNNAVGKLYLRLNPAQPEPAASTIEVSAGVATFWDATPSGSAALYSEGSLSGGTASLYSFDVATQTRTQLAGKLYGLAGASEDLSRIYLVSGVDHDGAGPAEEDQPNLYLYEGGNFTFVAKLLAGDVTAPFIGAARSEPFGRASRVTPDGRDVVFQSRAPLTGFDNSDAETGKASLEVFTYGAGETLRCVSCNPAGILPRGRELPQRYTYPFLFVPKLGAAAAWIPTWEHPLHASRVLSDDGKRIFFHSFDALLPRDTNGTVQDLYQWEAPGTGSCDTGDANYFAQNGGCLDLISSGESSYETEFFDADADGSDVFFTTDSRLVPQDPGSIDLYDARVGGGYPAPVTPAACEGEACQSPPPSPAGATPASSAYRGPGNVDQGDDCRALARRAAQLSRQAKRLRRAAKQAADPRAANRLRRKARSRAAQAKRKSRAAKRCMRANRRAAR